MSSDLKVSPMPSDMTNSPAWHSLKAHVHDCTSLSLRTLLAEPERFEDFHIDLGSLIFDYSRQRMTPRTRDLLLDLARQEDVQGWRDRMFSGDAINTTENRAVLHTACRRPADDNVMVDGENIMPFIEDVRLRMRTLCDDVHSGVFRGYTGKKITTIVNIGIGGSDLGPYMVCEALKPWKKDGITSHFISNVDPTHLSEALKQIDPACTLFLIASKTFTTQETMANATAAKSWLLGKLGNRDAIPHHFVALSTNLEAVRAFGISSELMFPFKNWVGGRFSLWSAIGLSIALSIGYDNFQKLLDGAYQVDCHFKDTPLEKNIPVLMALIGIWNRNFLKYPALAILPYDQYLHRFPAFLQQLDMESNGKSCTREGVRTTYETGPIVFGEPGTNGQHAFFQLLHQGTDIIPCDFIAAKKSQNPLNDQHKILLANMLAQSEAFAKGRTLAEAKGDVQRVFEGNRPSNILLFEELTPYAVGQLIALYEHKIFVQGVIWGINSFDQFGVELGKEMATEILSSSPQNTQRSGLFQLI